MKNMEMSDQNKSTESANAEVPTSSQHFGNALLDAALKSELVEKAKEFAIKAHSDTNHKYDGMSYDTHLSMVFSYAYKYSYLLPKNAIDIAFASAWTHDTIEDTRKTYNDVKNSLGVDVADVTYALTNEKGKNRAERANDKYYAGIRSVYIAHFIKICDRLANAKYSKENKSKMIDVYKKEQRAFAGQLWSLAVCDMFDELEMLLLA